MVSTDVVLVNNVLKSTYRMAQKIYMEFSFTVLRLMAEP